MRHMSDGGFHSGASLEQALHVPAHGIVSCLEGLAAGGTPLELQPDRGWRVNEPCDFLVAESIRAGLDNRERALEYALQFGRGLDDELADRFVSMYVNELTEDYGEEGRRAVRELLRRGEEIGAFTEPVNVEFVGS